MGRQGDSSAAPIPFVNVAGIPSGVVIGQQQGAPSQSARIAYTRWMRSPSMRSAGGMTDPILKFLQAIWQVEHALERVSARMENRVGVSGPQRLALRLIGSRPAMTGTELSMTMHLHHSTVTGMLQRLELRGLIQRVPHPVDGRRRLLRLTRAAVRLNDPSLRGTVEYAARQMFQKCAESKRQATCEVLEQFAAELSKIER